MKKRIYIARPRLDCSFKKGPVPFEEAPPRTLATHRFGIFLDNLHYFHSYQEDFVIVDKRPLWQFDFEEMKHIAKQFDFVYFPHRIYRQWPIGSNVLFYKSTALPEYITVDPGGWGASLSWHPILPQFSEEAWLFYNDLKTRIKTNISAFEQPALGDSIGMDNYFLFICQLPHDETIKFHSNVSVEDALMVVIDYAQQEKIPLVVKGHPANPKSMLPLKSLTEKSSNAYWVDNVSIHTCLAGARRVFMVNSGVGFEAMLHDKTIVHFGDAEYSNVTIKSDCSVKSLSKCSCESHCKYLYAAFLYTFFKKTILFDRLDSFAPVLHPLLARHLRHDFE
jgi:hypothetical protein